MRAFLSEYAKERYGHIATARLDAFRDMAYQLPMSHNRTVILQDIQRNRDRLRANLDQDKAVVQALANYGVSVSLENEDGHNDSNLRQPKRRPKVRTKRTGVDAGQSGTDTD